MIALVDYGAGNLQSIRNTLDEIGAAYTLVSDPTPLAEAHKIILPGVGHFGQMMRALRASGLATALVQRLRAGVPFFGICLGMHALFETSAEAADLNGFGLLRGGVERFPALGRVPHMGWNTLRNTRPSRLLEGLPDQSAVYFAHSYFVPEHEAAAACCDYLLPFTAVVEQGNLYGTQFHPEKSGPVGQRIVANFLNL